MESMNLNNPADKLDIKRSETNIMRRIFGPQAQPIHDTSGLPDNITMHAELITSGLELTDIQRGIIAGLYIAINSLDNKRQCLRKKLLGKDAAIYQSVEASIRIDELDCMTDMLSHRASYITNRLFAENEENENEQSSADGASNKRSRREVFTRAERDMRIKVHAGGGSAPEQE